MSAFRLAWLNLSRRKVPTLVALVSIAISVASGGLLRRLYLLSSSRFSTLAHGGDAIIGAKAGGIDILLDCLNLEGDYPGYIPLVLYQSLKNRQNVKFEDGEHLGSSYLKAVIPFLYFGKYGRYRIIGTDETFLSRPESANGPSDTPIFSEGGWAAGDAEVVLGAEVARQKGLKVGDSIAAAGWIGDDVKTAVPVDLKVTGIFAPTDTAWDQALFSNLDEARKVLRSFDLRGRSIWKDEVLSYYLIYLDPDSLPSLEALINRRTVAEVIRVDDTVRRLEDLTGRGKMLGFFISGLILFLGGLSVAAMMITRFDAMSIQLAVLRALGYERSRIRNWLLWEGLLLGLSACLLGGLVDGISFPWLRAFFADALPPAGLVRSPVYQSAPIWAAACLATMIAVFIPLFRVYRQDVHLSLKGM